MHGARKAKLRAKQAGDLKMECAHNKHYLLCLGGLDNRARLPLRAPVRQAGFRVVAVIVLLFSLVLFIFLLFIAQELLDLLDGLHAQFPVCAQLFDLLPQLFIRARARCILIFARGANFPQESV